MKVNFDPKSLEISREKVVTGVLSIHLSEGFFFPEERWNDNVVIILDAWMSSLNNLQQLKFGYEDFYFMDGPFFFRITANESNFVVEFFVDRKMTKKKEFDIELFKNSVRKSTIDLIEIVIKKGWTSPDIEKLIKQNI